MTEDGTTRKGAGGPAGRTAVTTPRAEAMLLEVLEGLRLPCKRIASKYHYDERGSKLFERITRLDEYYPTRTERALLAARMPDWVDAGRPAALVELGAGNAEKSRIVLDRMVRAGCGAAYVPVDVSEDFLLRTARDLEAEYPTLVIHPTVGDIVEPVRLPRDLPHPAWVAFLGSTLGNFDDEDAIALLTRIRRVLGPSDRLLLGVDLRPGAHKTAERIELAYNDALGVTAAFSLNVLAVLNESLGADFDLDAFEHRSVYSTERGRIETDLVSKRRQRVRFAGGATVELGEGEAVRTEISCKYDRPTVDTLFERSGLAVERWTEDERGYYALVLGAPA